MSSIWTKDIKLPQFKQLTHDIKTDVLIIGGGITGILCAYMLKKQGVDCAVVEANRICSGITKNTTAKISCLHGLIYSKMLNRFGKDTTRLYLDSQQEALKVYKNLCSNISCDFEEYDSFVYSKTNREKIEKEKEALEKIGYDAILKNSLPLPLKIEGAIGFKNEAQFHPLKFISEISKELPIYENTKVIEIGTNCVVTNRGKIKAEKVIVATHFPILNKHGNFFIKMYQHRSYAIAFENAPKINGMFVDEDKKGMSFREYNGCLIIGGGGHRTGKKGGAWAEISNFAKENYKGLNEICRWSTQDCITLDDIPYIGRYSKATPNLYVATGFNKWGMTSAMTSALVLSDLVRDKNNKYEEIFSPSRSILRSQLMINTAEALLGIITPTAPRCPHLGCALKYNPHEHSWDCSCHGSRFEKDGSLIDNPATDDLKLK